MPASITLSDLTWSTPDGRPLFSNLDLSFGAERTGLVGRNGVGKSTILRLITGLLQPQSGTVSVEGRIGLLRQSVQVEAEETVADLFDIAEPLAVLARAERGEASAEDLAVADWTLETRLAAALADIGLDAAPETRLAALSGGQRTRAALAALVFAEPDMLLLDEPTNNLDRSGREAVIELLARWRGGAIVVSHDRELLETMDAIVELTALGAKRYGGGWSQFEERRRIELSAAEQDLAGAEKRLAELAQNTQQQVERQARRDGVGKRKAARGDMPRIIAGGLKRRAEETGADKVRLAERRRQQAMEDAAAARERIEILQPFSAQIGTASLPAGKPVLVDERRQLGQQQAQPQGDQGGTPVGGEPAGRGFGQRQNGWRRRRGRIIRAGGDAGRACRCHDRRGRDDALRDGRHRRIRRRQQRQPDRRLPAQPQHDLQPDQPPQRAARGGGQARQHADQQRHDAHQHGGLQRGPGQAFQQRRGQMSQCRHLTSPCACSAVV